MKGSLISKKSIMKSYRLIGTVGLMIALAAVFSSCASQKLGCPMKITKVQMEKNKNC